jgi:cysteine desulfurase
MNLSLEYIAGLFDGEGYITVNNNKGNFIPTIGIKINGFKSERIPNILNIQFPGIDAEALLASLEGIAISMGSACTSGTTQASHVLSAMGLSDLEANSSLRFSFGRFTTLQEVQSAATAVVEAVSELRALSPIWESNWESA